MAQSLQGSVSWAQGSLGAPGTSVAAAVWVPGRSGSIGSSLHGAKSSSSSSSSKARTARFSTSTRALLGCWTLGAGADGLPARAWAACPGGARGQGQGQGLFLPCPPCRSSPAPTGGLASESSSSSSSSEGGSSTTSVSASSSSADTGGSSWVEGAAAKANGASASLDQGEPAAAVTAAAAAAVRPPGGLAASLAWLDALWRFCRPHTVIGTTLSILSVSLMALPPLSAGAYSIQAAVRGVMQALIPALCMNVYIVGLNQLFDIDIDKMNKPYLPLASGEFSVPTGIAIVSCAAGISVALGMLSNSPPLLATLVVSMLLGTAYSIDVPFLRWKRFPVLAAACILAVRAVVVQLGFFLHIQVAVLHEVQPLLTVPLLFATAFMCLFSVVIALFKDIPDVEGDRVYGILSLSVRLGQKRVYWLCVGILMLAYAAAVGVSLRSHILWSRALSVGGHVVAAWALWRRSHQVEFGNAESISKVYMFVWKLFYAEYLMLPLLRL